MNFPKKCPVGPRFQNWDLRIRPLGGKFTDNPIFNSKIVNSNAQRSKIIMLESRFFNVVFVFDFLTPGSINSLFSDFFREFWRGISGGVRDYSGEVLGGF